LALYFWQFSAGFAWRVTVHSYQPQDMNLAAGEPCTGRRQTNRRASVAYNLTIIFCQQQQYPACHG